MNHHAVEPGKPGGSRHYHLSKGISAHGWDSYIILAAQARPEKTRRSKVTSFRTETGISYTRIPVPGYRTNGLARLRSSLTFSARLLRKKSTGHLPPPDVVIGSTVHPFAAWAGYRLARRHGVPFVFEIRDLWPETLVQAGAIQPGSTTAKLMWRLEKLLVRNATVIVSPLSRCGEYLEARYGDDSEKFRWVSNGFSIENYPQPVRPNGGDAFTFMYFGSFGEVNEIDLMLDSFAIACRTSQRDLRLMMVGSGAKVSHARERVVAEGLSDVAEIRDSVPAEQVGLEMSKGDALLLAVADHKELYKFGFSANKMFDYLASGLPAIVAGDFPDNPFERAGSAIVVPPNDATALAEAMVQIAAITLAQRNALGAAGRELAVNSFEYRVLAARLTEVLEESVGR